MAITVSNIDVFDKVDIKEAIKNALQEESGKVINAIQAFWPKNSGRSSNAMESSIEMDDNTITLNIINPVEYVPYVHAKGDDKLSIDVADDVLEGIEESIHTSILAQLLKQFGDN